MSDPKSSYGEPIEEPATVDDVVGRANEGLADAEAARGDTPAATDAGADAAATESAPVDAEPAVSEPVAPSEPAVSEPVATGAPVAGEPVADPDPWNSPEAAALDYERVEPAPAAAAPTTVYETPAEPLVTPSEPVADDAPTTAYDAQTTAYEAPAGAYAGAAAASAAAAPQPIFVQAPEAPRPRGNRGAAGAIGLLAAVAFAVLFFGAWIGLWAVTGDVADSAAGDVAEAATLTLSQWGFWTPVALFFLAFWLLGAIINRGRWGAWVVFGLLVGVASYGGYILGQLFQAPFWMLTPSEGGEVVEGALLAPLAIAAFLIGRELTIWFGAWVAARGKRVTELNVEAQREYERTLEAGPQLVRQ
ncbi:hypothetical protein JOD63_002292 [Microbacterium terrae]|uniref:Uncharacterized protein n=1 Tax=Microbacterium terrae TaxID=69369 RepID=A0A0M2GZP9_9MICO|nr:hypothetical protein [Microbacterium terrae]KJL39388.1 hypothetical protein RS81_02018 [Microbacterium terrae]MBP1078324.1 hypothetical protein [Microbacterium terrae]GLJ97803.1 hypothetical protein GCM10017594_10000 [Microbacterium terrae]